MVAESLFICKHCMSYLADNHDLTAWVQEGPKTAIIPAELRKIPIAQMRPETRMSAYAGAVVFPHGWGPAVWRFLGRDGPGDIGRRFVAGVAARRQSLAGFGGSAAVLGRRFGTLCSNS